MTQEEKKVAMRSVGEAIREKNEALFPGGLNQEETEAVSFTGPGTCDLHSLDKLTGRIVRWASRVFGPRSTTCRYERALRFAEEALELAQAEGVSLHDLQHLATRVYSRPRGDKRQEAAGVMLTLCAWSHASQTPLIPVADEEMDRIEGMEVEFFRAKHQAKVDCGLGLPLAPSVLDTKYDPHDD